MQNIDSQVTTVLFFIAAFVFTIIGIGFIFTRLYKRATSEIAYVRTGFGGQKVVMNGGCLVFPILHETIPVNMNTLRLAVSRRDQQALITRDRMRVDVIAEFYVRTQTTAEAIANAAQTLGARTMEPQTLKDLVEGKFVDALRSVAAEMTMEQLHEKRTDFVQKVQQVVMEDLLKNGLELETVSLTALDQTDISFFNPNNAFDAEGLTKLTEEIQRRNKIRNDIEQETNVQIRLKTLEAEKQRIEILREEEYAKLDQEREIAVRKASQAAEITAQQADKKREAELAEILAKQKIEIGRIEGERLVEQERIEMNRKINEKEIEKNRLLESQEIEKLKAIELTEQDRAIAIAQKSKEQLEAQRQADIARAQAVQAEESVKTIRETQAAERRKQIELIQANQEAEKEAISIKVAATAEKMAAFDRAEAVKMLAGAEADAEKIRAAAAEYRYAVEAEGQRALNEAANILSNEQIALKVKLNMLENLADIIRESVKPMEKIEGIKIVQLSGLPGGGTLSHTPSQDTSGSPSNGHLADHVVNGALKYRAQAPLIDSLLKEVGIKGDDINGFTKGLLGE